jgi:polysaccharide biosynthesis protein PslE
MDNKPIQYWLDLVYRRRIRVATVAGIVFALIFVATIFWPPTYKSTALILIQDNRAQFLVSPDLQQGDSAERPAVVSNPVTEEDLNSEKELLTSEYLVRLAVSSLKQPGRYDGPGATILTAASGLLSIPGKSYRALHSAPPMSSQDRWILDLVNHLDAEVVKRSNVLEVSFKDHDSQWSHEFLTLLISRYEEVHARISHDPEAEKFFQQQAALLQNKLNASEEKFRTFQLKTGISDLGQQRQALISRLSDLQLEFSKNNAQLASAKEQTEAISDLLNKTPERINKEVKSVQDLALAQLKPQVMQLRTERAELLSRYQPNSQRIQQIDAKLDAAQRILDQENHLEVSESSTDLNPIWVTESSDLSQSKASAAALFATQKKFSEEIQSSQQRLNYLVENETENNQLDRQVAADREAYMSYVKKTEEARAAGALNSSKILNVSVAQPPDQPLHPVFPVVWLNIAAGLFLALALGIAAAEFDERYDPRIYSSTSIVKESGLPVIAVLADQR